MVTARRAYDLGPSWQTVVAVAVQVASTIALLSGSATGQPSPFEQVYPTGTPTALSGELTVFHQDDFARGRSELMHIVRDESTGHALTIRFQDQAARSSTLPHRKHLSLLGLDSASIPSAMVAGEQRTLVIVANFTDATVECDAKLHVRSRGDLAASAREIGLL